MVHYVVVETFAWRARGPGIDPGTRQSRNVSFTFPSYSVQECLPYNITQEG